MVAVSRINRKTTDSAEIPKQISARAVTGTERYEVKILKNFLNKEIAKFPMRVRQTAPERCGWG